MSGRDDQASDEWSFVDVERDELVQHHNLVSFRWQDLVVRKEGVITVNEHRKHSKMVQSVDRPIDPVWWTRMVTRHFAILDNHIQHRWVLGRYCSSGQHMAHR